MSLGSSFGWPTLAAWPGLVGQRGLPLIFKLVRYLPGILLCIAVTLFAELLQATEVGIAGEPYIEALVLAIVLGVAIRTASSSDFWPSLRRLPPA